MILGVSSYGSPIDIWATGCIFAELITQRPLFPGKTEGSQLLEQIAILGEIKEADLLGMSPKIPEAAKKLVREITKIKKKRMLKIL